MDGESEVTKFSSGVVVQGAALQLAFHFAKTFAQGEVFFGIAQVAQQAFHFVDALAGVANDAQSGGGVGVAGMDAFKQQAFEFTAIFRAIGVNCATPAVEAGARLQEFAIADCRLPIGGEFQA